MIDVHHTILPLTARPKPDAAAMLADAVVLENGLYVFSPTDMIIHSAAHLFADGELDGGLRNLWDIHCLISEFSVEDRFWQELAWRAGDHCLWKPVARALRLSRQLYATPTGIYAEFWQTPGGLLFGRGFKPGKSLNNRLSDRLFVRRLTARDAWGRPTRKFTRLAFYIRSHWLRMPPLMLAWHLWVKWRKGK